MSERFVFVESNTTGTGALAVDRLLGRGAEVFFLARRPKQYPFLDAVLPGLSIVQIDTNNVEHVAAEVERQSRERPLNAVFTFSEFYVPIVAVVSARFGLRYLSPGPASLCRDKFAMRCALAAAGLATPRFRLAASEATVSEAADEIGYPCIVKPPSDSSSKGVRLVASPEELLAHFRQIHAWSENDRGQRLTGEVLVESVLDGPEVSVETVHLGPGQVQVVGITAKHLSSPPLFVEIGHDFPAVLDPALEARISAEVVAALSAVGFDFGPAHTEVRLTSSGPVVVEINPRLAGGMIPELVYLATGIDLLSVFLDQLQGRAVDLSARRSDWASIRFLLADRQGILSGVDGFDAARALSTVRDVTLSKRLGVPVRPAEEAAHRLGHVIASGPSRSQVLADVKRALRSIQVIIEQQGS